MRTLYFDCSMGAAGDMLCAALYELLPDREAFLKRINSMGLHGVETTAETVSKCGINGTRFSVKIHGAEEHEHHHKHHHEDGHEHHHEHHHSSLKDIEDIINSLDISGKSKSDAISVYRLIAEAESAAHGRPVTDIHFHEVGTLDAVADIVTFCELINTLAPERITASPINVGGGQVNCAHGILPVPAPATAYILKDVPIYGGKIMSELCTPTGAALLKHFADSFGDMPMMSVGAVGYGMGAKDFEAANCVRAMLGEAEDDSAEMYELCCNIDDMTPEALAYATEKLLTVCNDVYTVPVGMKKGRTGMMICALCEADKRAEAVRLIMKHTSTIGIRERAIRRYTLTRRVGTVDTKYGRLRLKISEGYGVTREKYEFDDLQRAAEENGISIGELLKELNHN